MLDIINILTDGYPKATDSILSAISHVPDEHVKGLLGWYCLSVFTPREVLIDGYSFGFENPDTITEVDEALNVFDPTAHKPVEDIDGTETGAG